VCGVEATGSAATIPIQTKQIKLMLVVEFLSSDDVIRYARGDLDKRKRPAVEHALLDDDRARYLVRACAPVSDEAAFDAASAAAWRNALGACEAAIAGYRRRLMESPTRPATRRPLLERERQLKELLAAGKACGLDGAIDQVETLHAERTEEIQRLDRQAARELRRAFGAIGVPYLKARLADAISALEFDLEYEARKGRRNED